MKNEKELATRTDAAHNALLKDADKYCKLILGRVSLCLVLFPFKYVLSILYTFANQSNMIDPLISLTQNGFF